MGLSQLIDLGRVAPQRAQVNYLSNLPHTEMQTLILLHTQSNSQARSYTCRSIIAIEG